MKLNSLLICLPSDHVTSVTVLRKCSSNSTPGANGISYYHLKQLPCTHLFLATLYSKILHSQHKCPSWCIGKMILLHKKGPENNPANYQPIALMFTIGKLFNKILANRLENYLLAYHFMSTTTQKGFLTDISGTMEHILATTAILENAKSLGLPLNITFLDLSNAFGSISHQLINDMLKYVKVPNAVSSYVTNAYSQLKAFTHSRTWNTDLFSIKQGVFQGDTLSPTIFLLCFQPIIQLANASPQAVDISPSSKYLHLRAYPPCSSSIYLQWNEEDSDEPPGWYRCKVSEHTISGETKVQYPNGTYEIINLHKLKWSSCKGNS